MLSLGQHTLGFRPDVFKRCFRQPFGNGELPDLGRSSKHHPLVTPVHFAAAGFMLLDRRIAIDFDRT
jgi:hypothetical protein